VTRSKGATNRDQVFQGTYKHERNRGVTSRHFIDVHPSRIHGYPRPKDLRWWFGASSRDRGLAFVP